MIFFQHRSQAEESSSAKHSYEKNPGALDPPRPGPAGRDRDARRILCVCGGLSSVVFAQRSAARHRAATAKKKRRTGQIGERAFF